MQECYICYNRIYIGIKQNNCLNSHQVCYTCYYMTEPDKCCFCRRSSGQYDLYFNNQFIASYNYMPHTIEQFYCLLNLSYQQNVPVKELITLEAHEDLYIYFNGPIIKFYLKFALIFLSLSIFFYLLYCLNLIYPSHATTKCFLTYSGTRCIVMGYNYVYLLTNIIFIFFGSVCFFISCYCLYLSIRPPQNYFKRILYKKMNIL